MEENWVFIEDAEGVDDAGEKVCMKPIPNPTICNYTRVEVAKRVDSI